MDGVRLQLVTAGGKKDFSAMAENPGTFGAELDKRLTVRMPVKAGTHVIWATTVLKSHAPRDDLIKPFIRTTVDGLDIMGDPSVDRITIEGPFAATSPGDTASRRKIFVCNPAGPARQAAELAGTRPTATRQSAVGRVPPSTGAATADPAAPCARRILTSLARQAYRKPVDKATTDVLMDFYARGRKSGGNFDRGIESALQFILASPAFLFRVEPDPPVQTAVGRVPPKADLPGREVYQLGDLELASRLSFFLWSSLPDEQLVALAAQGKLRQPAVFEQQVRRMLADPRSKTLIDNFAEQWLHLRNLKNSNPDLGAFPDFDDNLRQAMKEE